LFISFVVADEVLYSLKVKRLYNGKLKVLQNDLTSAMAYSFNL